MATPVLLERLREKRIPEDLVRWIQAFCSDRKATVIVNGESTPILPLPYAGLPQGSPLSPILYLFFNATLIQSVINKNCGAIAFVDDFSAWVTGASIKENEERLQERIIPHVQRWANESGSVFQAKKTIMTHFTRHKKKLEEESVAPGVLMNGTTIKSSKNIKILGVILDQGLRYTEHVARARDKRIKAALAIKRLRNLRPETSRQLYKATVAAATDYASVIWSSEATLKTLSMLDQVQRIGSQAIIGAFRTTALAVSEVEASLFNQQLKAWIEWHTKPDSHRFWKVKNAISLSNKTWRSPLQNIAERFQSIDFSSVEKIGAYTKALWEEPPLVVIPPRKQAILLAQQMQGPSAFTNASERNNLLGIGCHWNTTGFAPISRTVAKGPDLSSYLGKLLAIEAALAQFLHSVNCGAIGPNVTVFSDSQEALRALVNPGRRSGQFLIRSVCQQTRLINASGRTSVSFQWSPGHAKIPGNEKAHRLAKLASRPSSVICPYQRTSPLLLVTALEKGMSSHRAKSDNLTRSSCGRFIKSIDKALPGPHTLALYKRKSKNQATTLC